MAERTVKVRLSAQVQEYISGMEKAAKATRDTGSEADKLAQKREAFTMMGTAAMVGGGMVLAGLGLATKAAIGWDSAWAGVLKTVDGTDDELATLEQGLRDLTSVLPASHNEIAAVAEAAGQLGIQTDNVVAFTKTMIDLGETTNLSSEEAATSLARFSNIMGTSQTDVDRLGSVIVGLGNNFATTEAEIVATSMRLAGAAVQANLTEGEVMGLATAMSSVGINAEAGGTAMSLTMKRISSEVETGGDKLGLFAQVAGMSAQEFSAAWKDDAATALSTFVEGLGHTEELGMSTNAVLQELGVTGLRESDALLRLSSAQDLVNDAMRQGNKEFEENTALLEEAEKRYDTTEAKLGIMKNQVVDAAISLVNIFFQPLKQ